MNFGASSVACLVGVACLFCSSVSNAFVAKTSSSPAFSRRLSVLGQSTTAVASEVEVNLSKLTGTSFLPEETVERAMKGSNIEKIKMAKDGTSAFVDVYEYARKIREGEMTWEDVEKADLDNVRMNDPGGQRSRVCPNDEGPSPHASPLLSFSVSSLSACSTEGNGRPVNL